MVQQFDVKNIKWIKGWRDLPEVYYRLKTPSVTSIINEMIPDPDLDKWKEDVGEELAQKISQAACYRGNAMHLFIEEFIKKYKETNDPSLALKHTQIKSVELLKADNTPEDKIAEGRDLFYKFYYSEYSKIYNDLIGTEFPIYSPFIYIRGKADVFYKLKGNGYAVTDFKTSSSYINSNSVKEIKYKTQLGGYSLAIEHMFNDKGLKINYASILCVNKKTNILQNIECVNDELEKYKQSFKTFAIEWHKKNNQEFLIKDIN